MDEKKKDTYTSLFERYLEANICAVTCLYPASAISTILLKSLIMIIIYVSVYWSQSSGKLLVLQNSDQYLEE